MKFKEWLINESFDKISDFLLNPDHRDKDWNTLMREFEKSGGNQIGRGSKGEIYEHPSWNYVLKTFFDDEFYIRFVRFATRNPHPSFPKFFGGIQRIVPFFKRYPNQEKMYLVRMEKLIPIQRETFKLLDANFYSGISYIRDLHAGRDDYEVEGYTSFSDRKKGIINKVKYHQQIIDLLKAYPNFKNVFEGLYLLENANLKGAMDIHEGNFMQRNNGDIVIIDPFFGGGPTPYEDHKRMMDMEADNFPDVDYNPPSLIGGKLYKKPKPPKPSKPTKLPKLDYEDPPF
jgi:hypothetical protein